MAYLNGLWGGWRTECWDGGVAATIVGILRCAAKKT